MADSEGEARTGRAFVDELLYERQEWWLNRRPIRDVRKKREDRLIGYPEPEQPRTEGLHELSPGWVWASVDQVAAHTEQALVDGPFGSKLKSEHYRETGTRVLRLENIGDGVFVDKESFVSPEHAATLWRHRIEPGDIAIATLGNVLPRVCIVPKSFGVGIVKADCIKFKPHQAVNLRFLFYWLQSDVLRKAVATLIRGVGRPRLNLADIRTLPIPLPSSSMQIAIASRIDELFSRIEAGERAIAAARASLKRYRKSILKAAVTGALTADWREERDEPAETGEQLLQRVLADRSVSDRRLMDAEYDFIGELPVEWCSASIATFGSVQLGRQRAPKHHAGEHMRPYLRVANVFEDRIDLSDVMEMNFTPDEFESYRLQNGDILLNEGQSAELVGRPAIYRGELPGACFTNTLVRFRTTRWLDNRFALTVFRYFMHAGHFTKIARITTNIAHLGAERFASMNFPLPPLTEQLEIVSRVESAFSRLDHAEATLNTQSRNAPALKQSILKAAFDARLVPQDPNDEPAADMLARIAREATTPEKKTKARA